MKSESDEDAYTRQSPESSSGSPSSDFPQSPNMLVYPTRASGLAASASSPSYGGRDRSWSLSDAMNSSQLRSPRRDTIPSYFPPPSSASDLTSPTTSNSSWNTPPARPSWDTSSYPQTNNHNPTSSSSGGRLIMSNNRQYQAPEVKLEDNSASLHGLYNPSSQHHRQQSYHQASSPTPTPQPRSMSRYGLSQADSLAGGVSRGYNSTSSTRSYAGHPYAGYSPPTSSSHSNATYTGGTGHHQWQGIAAPAEYAGHAGY